MRTLTDNEIMALVWIKCLNEFEDADCPEDELYEKVRKFDVTDIGMDDEEFVAALKGLAQLGVITYEEDIFEIYDNEPKCILTEHGEKVIDALTPIMKMSDNAIKNIINGTISVAEFVKKYGKDIINILIKFIG